MLAKSAVTHPGFERAITGELLVELLIGLGNQSAFQGIGPIVPKRCSKVGAQPVGQRFLSSDGRDTEQTVIVTERELRHPCYPGTRLVG